MGKEPPFKTIVSMMIGFALAAVGLDSVTGQLRLTFGFESLLNGFDFLIAVIGLFGIGEILLTMEEGLEFRGKSASINVRVVLQTWAELPQFRQGMAKFVAYAYAAELFHLVTVVEAMLRDPSLDHRGVEMLIYGTRPEFASVPGITQFRAARVRLASLA